MAHSIAWLKTQGIAYAAGDIAWLRARYPQITFKDGGSGFLEDASGALIAGRGVQTVVADAGLTAERVQAGPPERQSNGTLRIGGVPARSALCLRPVAAKAAL